MMLVLRQSQPATEDKRKHKLCQNEGQKLKRCMCSYLFRPYVSEQLEVMGSKTKLSNVNIFP